MSNAVGASTERSRGSTRPAGDQRSAYALEPLTLSGEVVTILGALPLQNGQSAWVMTSVFGAPGSGKSTVAPLLRSVLPSYVIVDWDAYMDAASELAGRDVRRSPNRWSAYRRLVRAIVETIYPLPLVMLGVCTPDELEGWPIDAWILLDCSDEERQHRLSVILESVEVNEALADAARYRALDLPVIDTTHKTPQAVAAELADIIRKPLT
jgi:hypothetical protein